MPGRTSSTRSTSASVLNRLRLNRIEPWAQVKGTPMARMTCEGSSEPEVQAEPELAQMPSIDEVDDALLVAKAREDVVGEHEVAAATTGSEQS